MAELVLGALLPVLFERLVNSPELLNFVNREKVGDLVKKWATKLRSISKLIADAEDKAVRGDDGVLPWLDDLRDLVYDIEDVVDEFVTEEGIRSLSKDDAAAAASGGVGITRKVRYLVRSCCTGLSPRKLKFDHKLRSRMEDIDGRLEEIFEQKKVLGLIEGGGPMRKMTSDYNNYERMTDSLRENYVVGRQVDEKAILSKLLTEETVDDHNLSVIPIVGMGGVGKTTLAKSVFNNPHVVEAFPQRGWACVSDNFNMLEIARALLGSLGGDVEGNDINVLHKRLGEILSKQRFLIVLDDYWNENYSNWDRLYNIYRLGVKGSRIIVTTRHKTVASMIKAGPMYHDLRELSSDDCLSLLEYHALDGISFDAHPHLKAIGKKIADKCGGLPLAAKALGGLLRSKRKTASDWEDILSSEIWTPTQGENVILPALKLSYFHLLPHLKRCFAFCAIFPEDYEFDRDELALLWMAEGGLLDMNRPTLVDTDRRNPRRSMLDHGRKHFDELLNRSFFQRSTRDESKFVMHDLMHDMAKSVSGIACLNVGLGEFDDPERKSPEKVRHLSYIPEGYEISARLEKSHVFKGLRTFVALDATGFGQNHLANKVVEDLLPKLKYLRALSLSGYLIKEVPDCIGYLKHLRYLNFSRSDIEELPESICTLYNLETLILKQCKKLTELPRGINKLINLRFLDIRGTDALKKMPLGLSHLHKLEILPKFIVGREDGIVLKELKYLPYLQDKLVISDLQNVEDAGDARDAQLNAKVGLTTVAFKWDVEKDCGNSNSRDSDKEMQVLDLLQPHPNIEVVEIVGYGGMSFPPWIGHTSMVNIKQVRLLKCRTTSELPSLGLLHSLKELDIQGMDTVCTVGPEFFGNVERPFPSLEVLKFRDMPAWEVWSFSVGKKEIDEPFPRLSKLELQGCPVLVSSWPHRLHSLVQLEIVDCPLLKASPSMADLSSLQNLKLKSCTGEVVASINPSTLTKISLTKIKELPYLNGDILSSLSEVESLEIEDCDELIRLWEDNVESVSSLTRLKSLRIGRCANLQKLPNNMQKLISLRELTIEGCSELKSLPEGMMSFCSLEKLCIEECGSLITCFPEGAKLPTTMRILEIENCEKLERLPEGILTSDGHNGDSSSSKNAMHLQLENLSIRNCPSLKPLIGSNKKQQGMQPVPSSLKTLDVSRSGVVLNCLLGDEDDYLCASLEEIKIHQCDIKRIPRRLYLFTNLTDLFIYNCPYLEVDVFPQLPSCLKSLVLQGCEKIKSLPHQMQKTCTSLQSLALHDLSIESFPEGGLPLSLEFLRVEDCKNLRQPMAEWGLHKLTALKDLTIGGCLLCLQGMTCFPPPPSSPIQASDWLMLPSNLEELYIYSQPNLVRLSNGLRNHLTSLQGLWICKCPELRFLPKEGFPPSPEVLDISGCSGDLQSKCSKSGEYFPLIERIPRVWGLRH